MNLFEIILEVEGIKITALPKEPKIVRACNQVVDCYSKGQGKGYWTEKYCIEYSDRQNKLVRVNLRVVFHFEIGKNKEQDARDIRRFWLQGHDRIVWLLRDHSTIEPEDLLFLPCDAPEISLFEANGIYDER